MKKESKYAILNFQKQDENLANILAENFDKETVLSLFKNNQTATTFLKTTLYPKAKEHYIGKEKSKDE